MKRLPAITFALALILNLAGSTFADALSVTAKRARSNQLVSMLPESDGVVTVDIKRFFDEAVPTLFSADKALLSKFLSRIETMQTAVGVDLRSFDFLAAGVLLAGVSDKTNDLQPVIIARGEVDAAALLAAAKTAADGKYKEERVNGKTIYIFASGDLFASDAANVAVGPDAGAVDKEIAGIPKDVAVSAIDANTIAFGDPARVRQAVEGKTHISADVSNLLNRKTFGVMNFAAKLPSGMGAFVPLDNDDLGKNIDSIRNIFGSMDVQNGVMLLGVTAKTQQNSQAQELHETLEVLQIMGKMLLGGSKRPDQQLYSRLIEKVKFTRNANELSLDLALPQGDIDELMAVLKK